jgi:glutaredoxin-related protein
MLKVYGSPMCPDCRNCKINFDKYGVEYEYIDINASLKNLKEFLILRDREECFVRLKKIHDIGIPAIMDGHRVFTAWETYLKELGHTDLEYEKYEGQACSIDGKGC